MEAEERRMAEGEAEEARGLVALPHPTPTSRTTQPGSGLVLRLAVGSGLGPGFYFPARISISSAVFRTSCAASSAASST